MQPVNRRKEPLAVPIQPLRGHSLAVATFAFFAVLVIWAAGKVIAPYLTSILLAAIVVTFTFPWYKRLRAKFNGRSGLAAVVMLLLITVVIVLPAFILTMLLIEQATNLFQLLEKTNFQTVFASMHLSERLMWVKRFIPGFDPAAIRPEEVILKVVRQVPALVATHGAAFLGGLASMVIGFLMMLLAAYYLYIEGERLMSTLMFLSPLPDEYDEEIFEKFRGVVDATFRGQILTALAQGTVTGIGLAIAGVPAPLLWGAVAALFSLIPMVGAAAVWVPATIYLALVASFSDGGYGWAIFLAVWGVAVVSLVDNVIRPWAMRAGTNMHAIVLFFSILGGISAFGFIGLLLGPLVFAMLVTVVHIYKNFFRRSLADQNEGLVSAEDLPALLPLPDTPQRPGAV